MFTAEHNRSQPHCFICCQLSSAVFVHSKVRKVMVNQTSKGTFLLYPGEESECGGGRHFLCFYQKILLFYAEHVFWLFFNPNKVLRSNSVPLDVNYSLKNWSAFNPKIDIFEILLILGYTFRSYAIPSWIFQEKVFYPCCIPGGIQTEEI